MRQPFWKILLSHLRDVRIEDVPSFINPHLYVTLSRGRYQLSTTHAIYSFGDLYGNFFRTFKHLDWKMIPGNEVLVLGLGLASIPYMLERNFNKKFRYTAIEPDEQVIYLAQKYVTADLHSPITVFHTDAATYLLQSQESWDLVCVDVFVDDEIPGTVQSQDFLQNIQTHLKPGGILLYNALSRTQDDIIKTQTFLDEVFLPVFPDGGYLNAGGNWILVSDKAYIVR